MLFARIYERFEGSRAASCIQNANKQIGKVMLLKACILFVCRINIPDFVYVWKGCYTVNGMAYLVVILWEVMPR